jgi:hypothetical protein
MGDKYGKKEWCGNKASGFPMFRPSPGYSSLFKLDHTCLWAASEGGGDDWLPVSNKKTAENQRLEIS